jgi:hypothetical protein
MAKDILNVTIDIRKYALDTAVVVLQNQGTLKSSSTKGILWMAKQFETYINSGHINTTPQTQNLYTGVFEEQTKTETSTHVTSTPVQIATTSNMVKYNEQPESN